MLTTAQCFMEAVPIPGGKGRFIAELPCPEGCRHLPPTERFTVHPDYVEASAKVWNSNCIYRMELEVFLLANPLQLRWLDADWD
jgi:hypothetical protein